MQTCTTILSLAERPGPDHDAGALGVRRAAASPTPRGRRSRRRPRRGRGRRSRARPATRARAACRRTGRSACRRRSPRSSAARARRRRASVSEATANSAAAVSDRPPFSSSSHTTAGIIAIRPSVSAFGIDRAPGDRDRGPQVAGGDAGEHDRDRADAEAGDVVDDVVPAEVERRDHREREERPQRDAQHPREMEQLGDQRRGEDDGDVQRRERGDALGRLARPAPRGARRSAPAAAPRCPVSGSVV